MEERIKRAIQMKNPWGEIIATTIILPTTNIRIIHNQREILKEVTTKIIKVVATKIFKVEATKTIWVIRIIKATKIIKETTKIVAKISNMEILVALREEAIMEGTKITKEITHLLAVDKVVEIIMKREIIQIKEDQTTVVVEITTIIQEVTTGRMTMIMALTKNKRTECIFCYILLLIC